MGLDAFVRCRCFEKGLISKPPLPMEDLYVDDDGCVWSHTLDEEHERLGREEYSRRYNDLEHQLIRWCDTCCKHEGMHICDEWVCNSSGWSELQWLFQQLGDLTPTLADMLPNGNEGSFPAALAERALAELDFLEKEAPSLMPGKYTSLVNCADGLACWTHQNGAKYGQDHAKSRFADGKLCLWSKGLPDENPLESAEFASAHFRVTLVEGKIGSCHNENRRGIVLLEDLDETALPLRMGWWDFCQIDPHFREAPVEYRVVEDSDEKWARWKIEILRKLLAASLETGNPIQWC